MKRRNFLGTALGFVASESFIAKSWKEKQQNSPTIRDYNFILKVEDNLWIQSPGVSKIISEPRYFNIECHTLHIINPLKIIAIALLNKNNDVIFYQRNGFVSLYNLLAGDTLKGTITINHNIDRILDFHSQEVQNYLKLGYLGRVLDDKIDAELK